MLPSHVIINSLISCPHHFAAAIEACLGHLLKRRAAGFLRSDKIAALFTKVGKVYDAASEVCRKVHEQLQQQADLTRLVNKFFPVHYVLILFISYKTVPMQQSMSSHKMPFRRQFLISHLSLNS